MRTKFKSKEEADKAISKETGLPLNLIKRLPNLKEERQEWRGLKEDEEQNEVFQSRLELITHLGVDVLNYRELSTLHVGWFRIAMESLRLLFLAPRSHFKSTCLSIIYPIFRIVEDPSVRILIINEVLENAKGFLREIKAHLMGEAFIEEFGNLCKLASRWSDTAITVPSARVSKDPTIGVAGSLGTIVSRHCNLIIVDDPISIRNSQTLSQRKKISRWFRETLLPILEPGGQIIVTGTRWHHDDLYGEILAPKKFIDWTKIVLQAEWRDKHGNQKILFPERFNNKELKRLKREMGSAYYNSQYRNDPSLLEGQKFKFDWLKFYETEPKTLRIFQGVDLAISKKDASAKFALVTIGIPPEGDIYLLDYVCDHLDFPEQCKMVKSQFRLHRPVFAGIENTAYQDALPQWLRADPEAKSVSFKGVPATGDKIQRIMSLAPLFEAGVIRIRNSMNDFVDEYVSFPTSGTFDILDALYMAVKCSKEQEVEPVISEIMI